MSQVFGLSEDDVGKVRALVTAFDAGRLTPNVTPPRFVTSPPLPTYVGVALTDIPASTGEPVFTTVELYTADLVTGVMSDQGLEIGAWSLNPFKIIANEWVLLFREPYSGNYFIISLQIALVIETFFQCLGNVLYGVTTTNGVVTHVSQGVGCCPGSSGTGSGSGSTPPPPPASIGFSISSSYSCSCLGLDPSVCLPYCLTYNGVQSDGCKQWSYSATGISIVLQQCGCLQSLSATFPGTSFTGWTLTGGCGQIPATWNIVGAGISGVTFSANLAVVCYSASNYWCVKITSGDSACGIVGESTCLVDSSLSPQPISVGEAVTWTASDTGCTGTVVSGPYTTSALCEAACVVGCPEGEVTGASDCCACMPSTLNVQLTEPGGTTTFTITWDGINKWLGSWTISGCGSHTALFECFTGGTFIFNDGNGFSQNSSYTCEPFFFSASGTNDAGTCPGTVTVNITE